jgi:hypothetical protein
LPLYRLEDGGMAEWFKAAVLKTVVRKYRGFESYSLRHSPYGEKKLVDPLARVATC